ncbi:hypothetical protein V6Z12_A05G337600 [Gossypium hirsutum]
MANQTPKSNPATANEPAKVAEREETKDDEIELTWREEEPAHYILEIQSLTFLWEILSRPQVRGYESSAFEASDHKWSLILNPEFENGDVYLSLYLRNMDIQHLGSNRKIDALINFFVYHHGMNRYITIQDGKVKRFSAEKEKSGFSRLMLLSKFIDWLNPQENTCKFGVEVFVVLNKYYDYLFRELQLYPIGVPEVKRKYLSIYLHLQDSEFESGDKLHVQWRLQIKSNGPSNPRKGESEYDPTKPRTGDAWFSRSQSCWGFPYFMKLADLKQTPGLIDNDAFTVEAEFNFIYVIQDLA